METSKFLETLTQKKTQMIRVESETDLFGGSPTIFESIAKKPQSTKKSNSSSPDRSVEIAKGKKSPSRQENILIDLSKESSPPSPPKKTKLIKSPTLGTKEITLTPEQKRKLREMYLRSKAAVTKQQTKVQSLTKETTNENNSTKSNDTSPMLVGIPPNLETGYGDTSLTANLADFISQPAPLISDVIGCAIEHKFLLIFGSTEYLPLILQLLNATDQLSLSRTNKTVRECFMKTKYYRSLKSPTISYPKKRQIRSIEYQQKEENQEIPQTPLRKLSVDSIDNLPKLPIELKGVTILSLGKICKGRGYQSGTNIFPVGFKSSRECTSIKNPEGKTRYYSSIKEGVNGPIFEITCEDDPKLNILESSASAAWGKLRCQITGKEYTSVSGPLMFGLADPEVKNWISKLPGATELINLPTTKRLKKSKN